jgi:two-component system OmpR family sensor kinase
MTVAITSVLHSRSQDQLLHQVEKTLEWKCDEVITVLQSTEARGMLQEFLDLETNYRSSPHTYFYQIRNAHGHLFARSQNLADVELPTPAEWNESPVHVRIAPDPFSPKGRRILLRSERVELARADREPELFVIEVAASLVPFESAVQRTLSAAVVVAAFGLTAIFFLLWLVTTRSLRPVSAMTSQASQITAKNLQERLPLAGTGDELDELANVLNDMLDRIGKSLHRMEQFSSDLAHQFRTPLTRIRGELDLIQRSESSDTRKAQIETLIEEVERMSHLCGRLLFLARIDQAAGDPSLFDDSVDLNEIVTDVLEQITPLAHDRGVELRATATSEMRVRGSRSLLVEVLLNLLHNAIRATPEGGAVTVSIEADNGTLQLCVQDEGAGVPKDQQEMIFQRFYRIPAASSGPMDDGSGLGLAIVRGIARAHGGRVELMDAPGGGSIFRVVLPAQAA